MFRLKRECFQNQNIESPLNQVARFTHTMIIYNMCCR
jgi:hypothetical protein